jgi:hypothetical protein
MRIPKAKARGGRKLTAAIISVAGLSGPDYLEKFKRNSREIQEKIKKIFLFYLRSPRGREIWCYKLDVLISVTWTAGAFRKMMEEQPVKRYNVNQKGRNTHRVSTRLFLRSRSRSLCSCGGGAAAVTFSTWRVASKRARARNLRLLCDIV